MSEHPTDIWSARLWVYVGICAIGLVALNLFRSHP